MAFSWDSLRDSFFYVNIGAGLTCDSQADKVNQWKESIKLNQQRITPRRIVNGFTVPVEEKLRNSFLSISLIDLISLV